MRKLMSLIALLTGLQVTPICQGNELVNSRLKDISAISGVDAWEQNQWQMCLKAFAYDSPSELVSFLRPVKELYQEESKAFFAATPKYRDSQSGVIAATENTFRLLNHYYYLQLEFGRFCLGVTADTSVDQWPRALIDYEEQIRCNITNFALCILRECLWCSACPQADYGQKEVAPHKLNALIQNNPRGPHFEESVILSPMLIERSDAASSSFDINSSLDWVDRLRESRLFAVARTLTYLHQWNNYNTLLERKWESSTSEDETALSNGELSASLIAQQYATWGMIKSYTCPNLIIPEGMEDCYKLSRVDTNIFYEQQEAFLRLILPEYELYSANNSTEEEPEAE